MSNQGFMMDTRRLAKFSHPFSRANFTCGAFSAKILKFFKTALDVHGKLRIRIKPDLTQNDTWVGIIENPRSSSDDDIGALYYVVAVIFIYGLSIVMMIASHIRKNKQDSQLRTYLKEMSNLRKTERREKVLHKMTDLAKREKEKAEREAESKRRLQEKLHLTGSGGESGDDTESDVSTSATPSSQARQQRRPLLAARKPMFGSTSPLGSVAAIAIKDEDEDETAEGGSDVPSGNESSEVGKSKNSPSSGDGKATDDGRRYTRRADYRKELRLSQSSSRYSPSVSSSPPIRSVDLLSPLSAETPPERTRFSFRPRSTSFNDCRRWITPNQCVEARGGRGSIQSASIGGQRSPGSSPSASLTDFRLSPLCGRTGRSLGIHENRTLGRSNVPHKTAPTVVNDTKTTRRNEAKQSHTGSKTKRPSSVTADFKSTFPASFYIVDEDAVL